MEQQEQQYGLEELIRQQPDPEVFKRVWGRVMPGQTEGPLVLFPDPRQEEAPAVPEPEPRPAPEEPPLCLGSCALGDVVTLTALMDRAQEALSAGQLLARRSGSRTLSELASDHRRALRQLSAARFLITGQRSRPRPSRISLPASLPLALREQFVRAQRWERDCTRAAEDAGDRCLQELYRELAQDGARHAGAIRSLLEQMQPFS